MKTKRCTRCKIIKPIDSFYKNNKSKDGKYCQCKQCCSEKSKEKYYSDVGSARAKIRKYYYAHREENVKRVMEWSKKNPKKHNAYIDAWHKKHREKGLRASKKWRQNNKDKEREKTRRWRAANPEKVRLQVENRRARKLGAGHVSSKQWREVLEKYGDVCLCCGNADKPVTMDHIIPLSVGGKHHKDNLQPLCLSCNSSKHTKTIDYRPGGSNGKTEPPKTTFQNKRSNTEDQKDQEGN